MHFPVGQRLAGTLGRIPTHTMHPGLLLHRYLPWPVEWKIEGKDIKERWQQVAQAIGRVPREVYEFIGQRQRRLLSRLGAVHPGNRMFLLRLETKAPLVVGLGGSSPLENSFTLHPLWGIPYLPASGLKGVMRHFIQENYCDSLSQGQARLLEIHLFGDAQGAGRLIILDTYPAQPLSLAAKTLRVDILNNHYPELPLRPGLSGKSQPA